MASRIDGRQQKHAPPSTDMGNVELPSEHHGTPQNRETREIEGLYMKNTIAENDFIRLPQGLHGCLPLLLGCCCGCCCVDVCDCHGCSSPNVMPGVHRPDFYPAQSRERIVHTKMGMPQATVKGCRYLRTSMYGRKVGTNMRTQK